MDKRIPRIAVDAVMTAALLLLMAREITGDGMHKALGIIMIVLWIIHNAFNLKWYSALFRGKYTPRRVMRSVISIALIASCAASGISGIAVSSWIDTRHFSFFRLMHISSSFSAYILMAVHLGMHWAIILKACRKRHSCLGDKGRTVLIALSAAIALYGLYAFISEGIMSYMFLTAHFVFFDYERPYIIFFADYISIMFLFAFISYYADKALKRDRKC